MMDIEYVKQWLDDLENLDPDDYWEKYENGDMMEDVPYENFVRTLLEEIERLKIQNGAKVAEIYNLRNEVGRLEAEIEALILTTEMKEEQPE